MKTSNTKFTERTHPLVVSQIITEVIQAIMRERERKREKMQNL